MAELNVASTTDTQADIDKAAGLEVKEQPEQIEEPQAEQQTEPEKVEAQPEKPSKSASQKRFDKLTRRISELEKQLETRPAAEAEQVEVQQETELPPTRPKPTWEEFAKQNKSIDEFTEALLDWREEQKQVKEAQAQQEAQMREIYAGYNRQADEARQKYADFDETLSAEVKIPQAVEFTLLQLDNGAEVAYYLGKHRDVAAKLFEMTEVRAVAEIGKIAASLGTEVSEQADTELDETEEIEQEAPPKPKAKSNAPPPIKPVGGSSTKSSVPLDNLDYQEYRRVREQQIKSRYRR